jgi:hypothetical protein
MEYLLHEEGGKFPLQMPLQPHKAAIDVAADTGLNLVEIFLLYNLKELLMIPVELLIAGGLHHVQHAKAGIVDLGPLDEVPQDLLVSGLIKELMDGGV